MDIRHIYWFSYHGTELPSVRYRAIHPLRHLWAWHGVGSTFVVPGWSPRRVRDFLHAYLEALVSPRDGSVIVVQNMNEKNLQVFKNDNGKITDTGQKIDVGGGAAAVRSSTDR